MESANKVTNRSEKKSTELRIGLPSLSVWSRPARDRIGQLKCFVTADEGALKFEKARFTIRVQVWYARRS